MKSHNCEFTPRELAAIVLPPLLPVALFAAAMHLGADLGWLPPPRPTLDTDRTILVHQIEAARRGQGAEVLLLGDSSCLMDVSARQLSEHLGRRSLNLATFSFLDLEAHAALLREYNRVNPTPPRAVVLLMHPEALRRLDSEPFFVQTLTNLLAGADSCSATNWEAQVCCLLGAEIFKGRFLSRAVPAPLAGAFGLRYGFSRDLERFLTAEHGSLIDPGASPFEGNAEYRLAPTLERASRSFRAALPSGARLFAGITPVPQSFARSGYPQDQAERLRQWAQWLQAEPLLELPATLPEAAFTRVTHLKESSVPAYTDRLATALRKRVQF